MGYKKQESDDQNIITDAQIKLSQQKIDMNKVENNDSCSSEGDYDDEDQDIVEIIDYKVSRQQAQSDSISCQSDTSIVQEKPKQRSSVLINNVMQSGQNQRQSIFLNHKVTTSMKILKMQQMQDKSNRSSVMNQKLLMSQLQKISERCPSYVDSQQMIGDDPNTQNDKLVIEKNQFQKQQKQYLKNIQILTKAASYLKMNFYILFLFDIFKSNMLRYKKQKLKGEQFRIIGDTASEYVDGKVVIKKKKINLTKIIFKNLCQFRHYDLIFSPFSKYSILFDFFNMILIWFWLIFFQIKFCFNTIAEQNYLMKYLSIAIFSMGILVRANTGFYQKGNINKNLKQILQKYKIQFICDITGIISILFSDLEAKIGFVEEFNTRQTLIHMLYFIQIFPLQKLSSRLEHVLYMHGQGTSHYYTLLKMLFRIVLMSHIIACFLHLLITIEISIYEQTNTWIQIDDLEDQSWVNKYNLCLYWATAGVMLIGTRQETQIEYAVSTILLYGTVGLFSYVISNVSFIIQEIEQEKQEYNNDLKLINQYMKTKKLNLDIQGKVRRAFENLYEDKAQLEHTEKTNGLFYKMPENIREEIQNNINNSIIDDYFKIFKRFFSEKTRRRLASLLIECSYVTNETIFTNQSDQHFEPSIYLVIRGSVDLNYKNQLGSQNKVHKIVTKKFGEIFGVHSFLTGLPDSYEAKCTTFSTIYKIKRKDFMKIIMDNQLDAELFCMLRDESILKQTPSKILQNIFPCQICQSLYHYDQQCGLLKYVPNTPTILYKYQLSLRKNQKRQRYYRVRQKSHSSFAYYIDLLYTLTVFQSDNQQNMTFYGTSDQLNEFTYYFNQFSDNIECTTQAYDELYNYMRIKIYYDNDSDIDSKSQSELELMETFLSSEGDYASEINFEQQFQQQNNKRLQKGGFGRETVGKKQICEIHNFRQKAQNGIIDIQSKEEPKKVKDKLSPQNKRKSQLINLDLDSEIHQLMDASIKQAVSDISINSSNKERKKHEKRNSAFQQLQNQTNNQYKSRSRDSLPFEVNQNSRKRGSKRLSESQKKKTIIKINNVASDFNYNDDESKADQKAKYLIKNVVQQINSQINNSEFQDSLRLQLQNINNGQKQLQMQVQNILNGQQQQYQNQVNVVPQGILPLFNEQNNFTNHNKVRESIQNILITNQQGPDLTNFNDYDDKIIIDDIKDHIQDFECSHNFDIYYPLQNLLEVTKRIEQHQELNKLKYNLQSSDKQLNQNQKTPQKQKVKNGVKSFYNFNFNSQSKISSKKVL